MTPHALTAPHARLSAVSPRLHRALGAHLAPQSSTPQSVGLLILSGHTGDVFQLPYQVEPKTLKEALRLLYPSHQQLITYSMVDGLQTQGGGPLSFTAERSSSSGGARFIDLAWRAQQEVAEELKVMGRHQHEPHQALMEIHALLQKQPNTLCLIQGVGTWEPITPERPDVLSALQSWPELCLKRGSLVIFADHNPSARLCSSFQGEPYTQQAQLAGPCPTELTHWLIAQELHQDLSLDPTLLDELARALHRQARQARVGLKGLQQTLKGPLDEAFLAQRGARAFDPKRVDVQGLECWFEESIIGQDRVKETVLRAAKDMKYFGAQARKQPLMRGLFTGPPGVGKTEVARGLSKHLYGQATPLLINCTELQQEHEVAKLLGAPPGYIGYGQPGVLERFIRERDAGVIIFDELEKAHESIHQALMGVLEEGVLHTPTGERVEFDRCVIIGTTNAGHRDVQRRLQQSPSPTTEELSALYEEGVARCFDAPLLRRFDLKLTFNLLTKAELLRVAELYLRRAIKERCPAELTVSWREGYLAQLASGCDATLGAGELKNHVESELKRSLIEGFFERSPRPRHLTLGLSDEPEHSKEIAHV